MKTTFPKKLEINRKWYLIDAKDQILGKIATKAALLLRGKHKPIFAAQTDCGDYVVIINSKEIKVTGKKLTKKIYYKHTGFMGNLYQTNLEDMLEKKPNKVLELAISGMIPHNRLKKHVLSKLHIYEGEKHEQEAQQPEPIKI